MVVMSDVSPADDGLSTGERQRSLAPRTFVDWVATVLGFGVVAALPLTVVLLNYVIDGEAISDPWLKLAFLAGNLVVAVPAVLTGVRARRTDPSIIGSIAFWVACVVGGWFTVIGVARFFFE